ncbi:2-oxoacid:acceptor oxidoreductase family protein [Pyrodictium occultum]|nr:2-oxoacid:acceptor oxidoreductase family protein [Pyrodictium occultum]
MPLRDVKVLAGGPQGSGIETVGQVLSAALAYNGYGILVNREYYSNIKGRHSYITLRASAQELPKSLTYPVELVGAMDAETVFMHYNDLGEKGFLVYNVRDEDVRLDKIVSMEDCTRHRIGAENFIGFIVYCCV